MLSPQTAFGMERMVLAILASLYGLAFIFYSPPKTKRKRTFKLIGLGIHILALAGSSFLLVLRMISTTLMTGHLPFVTGYETLLLLGWCFSFVFLVTAWRKPAFGFGRAAAVLSWGTVLTALILHIVALKLVIPRYPLPVLGSIVFEPHVIAGFLAYACFAMAFFPALTSLLVKKETRPVHRAVAEFYIWPGIILFTLALALGSYNSMRIWGAWWIPASKMAFAVATWGIFTLALVSRRAKRTSGAFPWLVILGFAVMIFTYVGTNKGLHDFM